MNPQGTAETRPASGIAGKNRSATAEAAACGSARTNGDARASVPPATATVLPPSDLIAVQQMNNVGVLASGLAHDMNNLLTVILGSAELARDTIPVESPARHHLRTITTTVRRAGDLCRSLLACARTDQQALQEVDLNVLVRDTVTLLQSSRLAFHRVRLDFADHLPALHGNPVQLRQAAMNLLTNAAEACGLRGGRIRVSTTLSQVDAHMARHLRPAGVRPGPFVRLRVADDGCGMDEETQQHLFIPFFTRKSEGRGLGLASLLEIARHHGGGVRVFSEPGRGSIFDVLFPVSSAAAADSRIATPGSPAATPVPEGRLRGTVLLADDDDLLRQSLETFLKTQGLTVQAVADGEAALAQLTASSRIDAVLIDLVMPKRGGLDVLRTLRAQGHKTPVILMTGHVDVAIADKLGGLEPAVVLTKPFSLVELLRVIGELLPQR